MANYRITSSYGWRTHPISGERKFHAGIDLVNYHKAPIPAFTGGVVIYSGNSSNGYGNHVIVEDSSGRGHLYAHLNNVLVKKGQRINKNQIVGSQGATGNVTGSHLHYEVRKKTSPSLGWTNRPQDSTLNPKQFVNASSSVNKNPNTNQEAQGGKRMVKKITVDGLMGSGTIRRTQQFFGSPVDGKLSRPSTVVKKWQEFLNEFTSQNIEVDGYFGEDTIRALQVFFGTPVDGKLSKPSLVMKKWQSFLNNYGQ